MEKAVQSLGYENLQEFTIKFAIPILGASFGAYFITMLGFTVPWYVPYFFLMFGAGFIFAYPFVQYEKKKVNIHENIHLFITYAGTISTLNVNRAQLFRKIAEQKQYGEISDTAERILYLAKEWNLGFAATCRRVARFSPSQMWADFLDRLAAVLDFGEDLEIFLTEEQDAVMNDYTNTYKQSLENIKMLQDVFISLTIAIAFALSAALLLPLLLGVSIIVVVQWGLVALVFMDLLLLLLIKMFIPADKLSIDIGVPDEGSKRIKKYLYIIAPISILIFAGLMMFGIPFLYSMTFGAAPLFIVGVIAIQEENVIFARDKAYPPFIRAVGGTIYVRGGGVVSALGALQVHDFGNLQPMMTNLYRRLRLGTEKIRAWTWFCGETGSALIYHFTRIFYESVYLGGNGEKIGKMISDNFSRLLNLRKLRLQLASSMRGALYGGLVGFVVTVYMAATITDLLSMLFGSAIGTDEASNAAAQMFASILPQIPPVDIGLVGVYIGVMVLIHSIASSLIIKMIDGGKWEAMFFDLTIMLGIGSLIAWVVPKMSMWAFGSIILGTPADVG